MPYGLSSEIWESIQQACRQSRSQHVYLFGSRARGDFSDRSDIDLAFSDYRITDREWLTVLNMLDDLPTLLPVDAVAMTDASEALKGIVESEGITIYERTENSNQD